MPLRASHTRLRRRVVAGIAVGLVLTAVAVVGTTTARVGAAIERIERVPDAFPAESTRPAPHPVGTVAPRNYLLLGSDSRGEVGSPLTSLGDRADAILLVHVPADRETVQVISIMRDSWVDIPGVGMAKINAALAYGGVPLMVQVVESLVGQRIDDVAIVDFAGFAALTDAVGGVTVQNDVAFSVLDAHFAQGAITLTGADALPYVRERYAFPDGDYQRVRNQQAYLRGLLAAILQPSTLANPWAVAGLVDAMSPYLAATDGLSAQAAVQLAAELASAGTPEVSTFTLPTAGTATIGDQSVVLLDATDVAVVQAALQQDSMTGFVPPAER